MPSEHIQPRIMILGAGIFQVSAIRKAVEAGYHAISVDNIPGNVGHAVASEFVICSTVDCPGVLQAARNLRVDGICTIASDVAVPSVAYVCDRLGRPGPSFEAAEIMTQKHRFRPFLIERGFPSPQFAAGSVFDEVRDPVRRLRFPVVFKPADSSGSRGIVKLDAWDEEQARAAFAQARSFSRSNTVCVEEFMEGTEVGGDAFLMDGEFAVIVITEKHRHGFAVRGHRVPCGLSPDDQGRVRAAILDVCRALGYTSGPLNFDVMIGADWTTVIELSPRCGGNGLPALVRRAAGVDLEQATLDLAIGKECRFPDVASALRGCGSQLIASDRAGMIQGMATPEALRQAVPEVFEVSFSKKTGDRVSRFEHGGDIFGCVMFDCDSAQAYERISNGIRRAVSLVVSP